MELMFESKFIDKSADANYYYLKIILLRRINAFNSVSLFIDFSELPNELIFYLYFTRIVTSIVIIYLNTFIR